MLKHTNQRANPEKVVGYDWLGNNNKVTTDDFDGQLSEKQKIIFYNDMLWKAWEILDA